MMQCKDPFEEVVVIIAAARSGTKMMRQILSASPEFACYSYDLNYIWKYGNYHIDHDELVPEDLGDKITQFIRGHFAKLNRRGTQLKLLEKTVSNSLRVDFVRAVFPQCKIIHLFRDGIDVAASARRCWLSPRTSANIQSKRDLIDKVIHFPYLAAWPYLFKNAAPRWIRASNEKTWGPRFKGIDDCLQKFDLLEVCGIQWVRCVQRSLESLAKLTLDVDYLNVRYEDFVLNPFQEIERIARFLDFRYPEAVMRCAQRIIKPGYVGSGKEKMASSELDKVMPHIRAQREALGYE